MEQTDTSRGPLDGKEEHKKQRNRYLQPGGVDGLWRCWALGTDTQMGLAASSRAVWIPEEGEVLVQDPGGLYMDEENMGEETGTSTQQAAGCGPSPGLVVAVPQVLSLFWDLL